MPRTALTLSTSTVTFPVNTLYLIPNSAADAITKGFYTDFPAPWASVSGYPSIELSLKNDSTSAPIAPILCDKWVSSVNGQTYYYPVVEFTTVQPGQSSPIKGAGAVAGEVAAVMPTTTMRLALMYLAANTTDTGAGWTATVQAWTL